MTQWKLWIKHGVIIGLHTYKQHRRWKTCKWCGHTFMPHHNKQAYCDRLCKSLSRQQYKRNYMYTRRIRERNGEVVNDRSILNVGTGGLGEHRCCVDGVEHRKILKEMRELGLR